MLSTYGIQAHAIASYTRKSAISNKSCVSGTVRGLHGCIRKNISVSNSCQLSAQLFENRTWKSLQVAIGQWSWRSLMVTEHEHIR